MNGVLVSDTTWNLPYILIGYIRPRKHFILVFICSLTYHRVVVVIHILLNKTFNNFHQYCWLLLFLEVVCSLFSFGRSILHICFWKILNFSEIWEILFFLEISRFSSEESYSFIFGENTSSLVEDTSSHNIVSFW